MRTRLMIFSRFPEPGRTKTRLIPHLGAKDIPPRISVIIPTLNEEKNLVQTLDTIERGFHVKH